MPAVHIAIIDTPTAARLLAGRKRVESRFSRRRRPPYGRVLVGDRIYFKVAGGQVIGHSFAKRVVQFAHLTPTLVDSLHSRYNRAILAPPAYWAARRDCRFAVLIWLTGFTRRASRLKIPRQYGNGWVLLSRPVA